MIHGYGNLPGIFIDNRTDKVRINNIIRPVVLIQQADCRLKLFQHMVRITAFKKCNHFFMIPTGFWLGKIVLEPIVDREKQFLFFCCQKLIPDQVPAQAEIPLGYLVIYESSLP